MVAQAPATENSEIAMELITSVCPSSLIKNSGMNAMSP